MKDKLRQFRALGLEAKLTELYKELLELREQKQELPSEITSKMYCLKDAAVMVNMSREWLTKEIRSGRITASFERKKYFLSWQGIERIKELRKK
ncbi:MAG: hypothetical protein RBT49_15590 [Bacteroidales bacterium]|jgi:hypothetical protein|nr:hypothetical protein [Bacteroidales bacterium]